jgi:hypothetical protein
MISSPVRYLMNRTTGRTRYPGLMALECPTSLAYGVNRRATSARKEEKLLVVSRLDAKTGGSRKPAANPGH